MTDQEASAPGQLPRLTTSNHTYWYEALEIYARRIKAANLLTTPPSTTAEPDTEDSANQQKADMLRKAIMQSPGSDVIKMLPPHILRYEPQTICHIIRSTVDTSSTENHELLDAEARNTTYQPGLDLHEYVEKHREVTYRMQAAQYPNINVARTTVRYMIQGLAPHPDMGQLAIIMTGNPPPTINGFTNHVQQV